MNGQKALPFLKSNLSFKLKGHVAGILVLDLND